MKVALSIASFRQNAAVCELLDKAFDECRGLFSHVFVVESMGDGSIAEYARAQGYEVTVFNADHNLGSAGNLALRLELAAKTDATWMYALNHDGELTKDTVRAFIDAAETHPKAGAFYPLRKVPLRKKIDITGTQRLPLPFYGTRSAKTLKPYTAVRWGSSNGAFYHLQPIRENLCPPAEFWMGWEDLAYGWLLDQHQWPQYVVRDAVFVDDREYLKRRILGKEITISDKPAWYAYYFARNFVLLGKEKSRTWDERATIAARIGLEMALSTLFKPNPAARLKLITVGVKDGLLNKTGKWKLPS